MVSLSWASLELHDSGPSNNNRCLPGTIHNFYLARLIIYIDGYAFSCEKNSVTYQETRRGWNWVFSAKGGRSKRARGSHGVSFDDEFTDKIRLPNDSIRCMLCFIWCSASSPAVERLIGWDRERKNIFSLGSSSYRHCEEDSVDSPPRDKWYEKNHASMESTDCL